MLRQNNFEGLIKEFEIKKGRENFSNINKVEVYINRHYFPSYCKFYFILKHNILFCDLKLFLF